MKVSAADAKLKQRVCNIIWACAEAMLLYPTVRHGLAPPENEWPTRFRRRGFGFKRYSSSERGRALHRRLSAGPRKGPNRSGRSL